MPIIPWIAAKLLARGVSGRAAGPLSWLIGIGGALLLLFMGWQLLVHVIISKHDADVAAKTAETQLKRTNEADAVDAGLERRDQDADERLGGVIDDAKHNDPKSGAGSVGPVSNAAVDELRASRKRKH